MTTMEKLRRTMMLKSMCTAKTGQQLQFGGKTEAALGHTYDLRGLISREKFCLPRVCLYSGRT